MRASGFFVCLALGILALPVSVSAQESTGKETPPVREETLPENPYQDQIRAKALKLSKSLDEPQITALTQLRTGFGMIRAVRLVKNQVAEAVSLCAEKNPKMGEQITAEYATWEKKVSPVLEAEEKIMNDAIRSGIFKQPDDIRGYLDLIDKSAAYADEQLEEQVVTTPQACQGLADSMSETEKKLVSLLESIEWPSENTSLPEKDQQTKSMDSAPAEKVEPSDE